MNGQIDLASLNVISSIDICTIDKFEKCIIDEDLTILGGDTKEINEAAWLKIYSDYLASIDDGRNKSHIATLGRIHYLSGKIQIVKMLCQMLVTTGYREFYNCLKEWGYHVDKMEDTKAIIAQLKRDEMDLSMLINQLPKESGGIDKDYFTNMIVEFEEMQGFGIEKSTLTVAKFCQYHKKMAKKREQKKTQPQNKNR